jgi:hypothetical protein
MAESLTTDILEAVADYQNVAPEDVDLTIAEYIDTDALAQLRQHDHSVWMLTFRLPEHDVTVTSDGDIFVDDQHMQERF